MLPWPLHLRTIPTCFMASREVACCTAAMPRRPTVASEHETLGRKAWRANCSDAVKTLMLCDLAWVTAAGLFLQRGSRGVHPSSACCCLPPTSRQAFLPKILCRRHCSGGARVVARYSTCRMPCSATAPCTAWELATGERGPSLLGQSGHVPDLAAPDRRLRH